MNLVEELLKADASSTNVVETKKMKSKRLAKILGKKESVEITIQAIKAKRMNDILTMQVNKKGNYDVTKNFDAKLIACVEGIIDPPVKEEKLLAHFLPNGGTPKDLVLSLFDNEINDISDEIIKLSGVKTEEEEEEDEEIIKN